MCGEVWRHCWSLWQKMQGAGSLSAPWWLAAGQLINAIVALRMFQAHGDTALALLLFALQPFAIMLLFHQRPGLVAWRGTPREPSAVRGNAVSGKTKRCPIIQQWLPWGGSHIFTICVTAAGCSAARLRPFALGGVDTPQPHSGEGRSRARLSVAQQLMEKQTGAARSSLAREKALVENEHRRPQQFPSVALVSGELILYHLDLC